MLTMDADEARKNDGIRLSLASLLKDDFEVEDLYVGDFAALDTPLSLGIERKAFGNLVQSLASNELDEQLSRMLDVYDLTVLLVEDMPAPNGAGKVRVYGANRDYSYAWVVGSIAAWHMRGVMYLPTSKKGTPLAVKTLYQLVAKDNHRHSYSPKKVLPNLRPMTLAERVMLQFPGVGEKRAHVFRDKSPLELANWQMEQYQGALGKVTGKKVWEAWQK